MWVKVLCVLVLCEALGNVVTVRIIEGEKHVQEKKADQEGSASELRPGSAELQHSFGVKIEHPSSEDLHGRTVEHREHHVFGNQPTVNQQSVSHLFQPSPTSHASVGGEWRGITRFNEHQDQESLGQHQDLSQHQVLGQVLQGLGQVNQILGKNHQGIEQVNQIFGQENQNYHNHNSVTNGNRDRYALRENNQEELSNHVEDSQGVTFEKTVDGVTNNFKDVKNYNLITEFKPLPEPHFSNLHKPLGKVEVNTQNDVKTITVTKEVPVPYPVEVEKKVPYKVEVPVDRPYTVERPKPYPVYVEKRVPYKVKEYVPQPYTVYKRVPYTVKVHVSKPYPVHVPKPYRVLVEKKVPYPVEKRVPYPVRVYVDKPYPIHVPVLRTIPYTVERKVPLPVQVPVEKPYHVPVPKPYTVYVEKKVPYSTPLYHQQEVQGSGQAGTTEQGATHEFQSHYQHPQWKEYLPYHVHAPMYHTHGRDQQEVERSRQPGTTDQGATSDLQSHYSQWREHVAYPVDKQQELSQQEVEGSGQATGNADQGATIVYQRHQQHLQREYVTNPVDEPTNHQRELTQQLVEESALPSSHGSQHHA